MFFAIASPILGSIILGMRAKKDEMTLQEVGRLLIHVIDHMVTKEDLERYTTKDDFTNGLSAMEGRLQKQINFLRADIHEVREEGRETREMVRQIDQRLSSVEWRIAS